MTLEAPIVEPPSQHIPAVILPGSRSKRPILYPSTPAIDARIAEVYQDRPGPRDARLEKLAAEVDRPRWWVSRRARKLGLVSPRKKEPRWQKLEDLLLEQHRGKSAEFICRRLAERGFKRTATAVTVRAKRLGISRDDPLHLSATGLARLLGLDNKTVSAWVCAGLLPATKRGTKRTPQQGGDEWSIALRDVRRFCIDHVERIDLRKVDKLWFIDLLSNPALV